MSVGVILLIVLVALFFLVEVVSLVFTIIKNRKAKKQALESQRGDIDY